MDVLERTESCRSRWEVESPCASGPVGGRPGGWGTTMVRECCSSAAAGVGGEFTSAALRRGAREKTNVEVKKKQEKRKKTEGKKTSKEQTMTTTTTKENEEEDAPLSKRPKKMGGVAKSVPEGCRRIFLRVIRCWGSTTAIER